MKDGRYVSQVLDFLSTLDVAGDQPDKPRAVGLPGDVAFEFREEADLLRSAEELQDALISSDSEQDLLSRLAGRILAEPRLFLVVMHTVRQIRFTNLELVRILFDPEQLNSVVY